MTQPRRQLVDPTHAGTFQCVHERLVAGRSYQTLDSALSGPCFPVLRAKDRCDCGKSGNRGRISHPVGKFIVADEIVIRTDCAQCRCTRQLNGAILGNREGGRLDGTAARPIKRRAAMPPAGIDRLAAWLGHGVLVLAHWHYLQIRLGATTGPNYHTVDATGRNMQGQCPT